MNAAQEPAGIDVAAVTAWFAAQIPQASPPLDFELVLGGRSNLTYIVTDTTGRRWVLRRPPTGAVLPSAHNVLREQSVLAALAGTAVPVPPVAGFCADPAITGADFYVMDFVDGVILNTDEDAAVLAPGRREAACLAIVDTLVDIHRIDCGTGPLAALRRPGSYIERQLRRWTRQLDAVASPNDGLRDVAGLLAEAVPPQRSTGLVHGDYRPGNLIVGAEGTVRAVLDWELCAVGDVLTDLGWLVAWWSAAPEVGWAPDPAAGFLTAERLVARYEERTGRTVGDLDYYHGFALWRLGCIADGVYQRYRDGAMGVAGVHLQEMAERPGQLAQMSRELLTG